MAAYFVGLQNGAERKWQTPYLTHTDSHCHSPEVWYPKLSKKASFHIWQVPKVAGFRALCGPVLQIPVRNVANFGMSDSSPRD